jgi:hypothetical protein
MIAPPVGITVFVIAGLDKTVLWPLFTGRYVVYLLRYIGYGGAPGLAGLVTWLPSLMAK